jgi:hypothetical protein
MPRDAARGSPWSPVEGWAVGCWRRLGGRGQRVDLGECVEELTDPGPAGGQPETSPPSPDSEPTGVCSSR